MKFFRKKCKVCGEVKNKVYSTIDPKKPMSQKPVIVCGSCFSVLWKNSNNLHLENRKKKGKRKEKYN